MDLRLHPRQGDAFLSPATEILYGGAAGGGKSHLLRIAALAYSYAIPGLQTYLFRRTYPELLRNHMQGPSSFPVLLAGLVKAKLASINWGDMLIEFWNDSIIHLCHCQREKDVYLYQGAEIHLLLPDELTLFAAPQYRFLRSRVRIAGLEIPERYRDQFPRIIASSNPGNVGHNWVKAAWIDPKPPMEIWSAPPEEGGMRRQFIPARLADNPSIVNPEQYRLQLQGLGDPALVKAMEDGDWNIVAGGAIDDVWDEDVHVIPPFAIPSSWHIDRSLDWGSSKPFSIGLWAESDGTEAALPDGSRRWWPKGTLFRIMELYGWNGQPNEGCKKLAGDVATELLQVEAQGPYRGRVQQDGPADSSIFDAGENDSAASIADTFAKHGVRWSRADKGPGSRKQGLEAVRGRLSASKKRPMEDPGIFFFSNCRHAIRTIPTLPRDPNNSEDVDTASEDHPYDETRYRIRAVRHAAGSMRGPMRR
jgi:hypothetical protein